MFETSNQNKGLIRSNESTVLKEISVISGYRNEYFTKFQLNKQLQVFSFFSSIVLIELEWACLLWSLPVLVNILTTSEHTNANVDSQCFFVFKTLEYLLPYIFPIFIIIFAETHIYKQDIKTYKATEG